MVFFVAFNIQSHIATVSFPYPYIPWVCLADPSFITSTLYTFPCQLLTTALLETVVGGKLPKKRFHDKLPHGNVPHPGIEPGPVACKSCQLPTELTGQVERTLNPNKQTDKPRTTNFDHGAVFWSCLSLNWLQGVCQAPGENPNHFPVTGIHIWNQLILKPLTNMVIL